MNLKKWVAYLLAIINIIILMTITNNDLIVDIILFIVFTLNTKIILKYDHKYIGGE